MINFTRNAFYPRFRVLSSIPRFIPDSAFYPPIPRFIPDSAFYPRFRFRIPVPYSGSAFRFRIPVPRFIPIPFWLIKNVHYTCQRIAHAQYTRFQFWVWIKCGLGLADSDWRTRTGERGLAHSDWRTRTRTGGRGF